MSLRLSSHGQGGRWIIKHERDRAVSVSVIIAKTDMEIFLLFSSCSRF